MKNSMKQWENLPQIREEVDINCHLKWIGRFLILEWTSQNLSAERILLIWFSHWTVQIAWTWQSKGLSKKATTLSRHLWNTTQFLDHFTKCKKTALSIWLLCTLMNAGFWMSKRLKKQSLTRPEFAWQLLWVIWQEPSLISARSAKSCTLTTFCTLWMLHKLWDIWILIWKICR